MQRRNNKAQITMWVIIAIFIVAAILLLILLPKNPNIPVVSNDINLNQKIEKCVRDSVNEAADKMTLQGGFLEPQKFVKYNNINVTYLCLNIGYFKTCVNQHPMLINEEVREITNYIVPITENCFETIKSEFEKRGYSFEMSKMLLNVTLTNDIILVDIQRDVNIQKNDLSEKYDKFKITINHPIFDLSNVAMEISSQQAKNCYFEYVGYMILYPRFDIKVFTLSDSTKIYTIMDKHTEKEMNIATRSCAIVEGL